MIFDINKFYKGLKYGLGITAFLGTLFYMVNDTKAGTLKDQAVDLVVKTSLR